MGQQPLRFLWAHGHEWLDCGLSARFALISLNCGYLSMKNHDYPSAVPESLARFAATLENASSLMAEGVVVETTVGLLHPSRRQARRVFEAILQWDDPAIGTHEFEFRALRHNPLEHSQIPVNKDRLFYLGIHRGAGGWPDYTTPLEVKSRAGPPAATKAPPSSLLQSVIDAVALRHCLDVTGVGRTEQSVESVMKEREERAATDYRRAQGKYSNGSFADADSRLALHSAWRPIGGGYPPSRPRKDSSALHAAIGAEEPERPEPTRTHADECGEGLHEAGEDIDVARALYPLAAEGPGSAGEGEYVSRPLFTAIQGGKAQQVARILASLKREARPLESDPSLAPSSFSGLQGRQWRDAHAAPLQPGGKRPEAEGARPSKAPRT